MFDAMWRRLALASLLVAAVNAYAPIHWMKSSDRNFVLAPNGFPSKSLVPPQKLTLKDRFDGVFVGSIPSFTARSDKAIVWDAMGWCVEAGGNHAGDEARVNHCTGEAAQRWNWVADAHGQHRIQLENTNKCLDVSDKEGSLKDRPIELQECDETLSESWMFEGFMPASTQDLSQLGRVAPSLRHVGMSFLLLAALTVLIVIVWVRSWKNRPRVEATGQSGRHVNIDHGGVALTTPLATRQRHESLTLSVAPTPGPVEGLTVPQTAQPGKFDSVFKLPNVDRRTLLSGVAGLVTTAPVAAHASFEGADWPLWPALPIAPYSKRKTVINEAIPGRLWTFDQLFGIFYVHVPIRMTVLKLDSGGLFVYAPVAPTKECLSLLQPLIASYGPIKHIVLPSVAPEHKVLAGPFARNFPSAEFHTTDRQYSFPLNLPSAALGFPGKVNTLPASSRVANPFGDEFEFEVFTGKASKESVYQDAAFYHKPSKTVLLCDAIIATNAEPPPILLSEPETRRALLYHARDGPLEKVEDTPEVRRKGWERIVLFGNFFMPGSLDQLPQDVWLSAAPKSPMPELGWGGALPFTWRESTSTAFRRFSADGKPLVAPIIQIIFSRAPEAAKEWVQQVSQWDFERVVPAHFDAPISMGSADFVRAFDFVVKGKNEVRYCQEDVQFLSDQLEGLPPDLALFPTPFGPLQGEKCNL